MRKDTTEIYFDVEELHPSSNWVAMFRYTEPVGAVEEIIRDLRKLNPNHEYRLMRIIIITKYKEIKVYNMEEV